MLSLRCLPLQCRLDCESITLAKSSVRKAPLEDSPGTLWVSHPGVEVG
jgi:hypothetical protein